jgi:hypothetical protein
MRLVLQIPDRNPVSVDQRELLIGSDPSGDVYLPNSRQTEVYARIRPTNDAVWLLRSPDSSASVHLNGRRVHAKALVRAGDELHFDGMPVQVKTELAPAFDKPQTARAVNFSGRIVLRVHSGAETGKAFALVNSLCIGRSAISEVCVDDPALAERQILLQRQGNDVLVKNLSPALEMRVDGWVCEEALLKPGSQLNIEQHRFVLESPAPDLASLPAPAAAEVPKASVRLDEPQPSEDNPPLFSRSQWILLGSALGISVLLVILLTISP